MSNYTQATFFGPKDALVSGNPAKLIKGVDVDVEFAALSTAIASKADSTALTGFVPLSGGAAAVNGTANNTTTNLSYVSFRQLSGLTENGFVGFGGGTSALYLNNSISGGNILIDTNGGSVLIDGGTAWHSGNDGSGSGLDADTVDGQHASAFAASSHTHSSSAITNQVTRHAVIDGVGGSVLSGSGLGVTKGGTGSYSVTYSSFGGVIPSIVASLSTGAGTTYHITVTNIASTSCTVSIFNGAGSAADAQFTVIAVFGTAGA